MHRKMEVPRPPPASRRGTLTSRRLASPSRSQPRGPASGIGERERPPPRVPLAAIDVFLSRPRRRSRGSGAERAAANQVRLALGHALKVVRVGAARRQMRSQERRLGPVRCKAGSRNQHIACAALVVDHGHGSIVRRNSPAAAAKSARLDRRFRIGRRGRTAGQGRRRNGEAKVYGGHTQHRAPSINHLNTNPELDSGSCLALTKDGRERRRWRGPVEGGREAAVAHGFDEHWRDENYELGLVATVSGRAEQGCRESQRSAISGFLSKSNDICR